MRWLHVNDAEDARSVVMVFSLVQPVQDLVCVVRSQKSVENAVAGMMFIVIDIRGTCLHQQQC